jgi:MinD-like ATPase involved in chromosome partitioning or flagellar assembly
LDFRRGARAILAERTGNSVDPKNLTQVILAEGIRTIVAVHSYKGGTGKTLISANLATLLAAESKKTCLLDMDFLAPSLHSLFKSDPPDFWLNDYMNGACKPEKMLKPLSYERLEKEKLFIGFANPSTEAIREMSAKDRKWEMQALARLLSLRDSLLSALSFDYLILDTSPGLQYSSINAIATADMALLVTTLDESDLRGTLQMLHDLYEHFGKKTAILLNKVLPGLPSSEMMKRLQSGIGSLKLVISVNIPCSCEIPVSENPCFYACEKPYSPLSRALHNIASVISTPESRLSSPKPALSEPVLLFSDSKIQERI